MTRDEIIQDLIRLAELLLQENERLRDKNKSCHIYWGNRLDSIVDENYLKHKIKSGLPPKIDYTKQLWDRLLFYQGSLYDIQKEFPAVSMAEIKRINFAANFDNQWSC